MITPTLGNFGALELF